jgi:hypothetical protein
MDDCRSALVTPAVTHLMHGGCIVLRGMCALNGDPAPSHVDTPQLHVRCVCHRCMAWLHPGWGNLFRLLTNLQTGAQGSTVGAGTLRGLSGCQRHYALSDCSYTGGMGACMVVP